MSAGKVLHLPSRVPAVGTLKSDRWRGGSKHQDPPPGLYKRALSTPQLPISNSQGIGLLLGVGSWPFGVDGLFSIVLGNRTRPTTVLASRMVRRLTLIAFLLVALPQ